MKLHIGRNDRVDFFGRTGSGKTTLARSLLRGTDRDWVIFDPKHMIRIPKVPIRDSFSKRHSQQVIRDPSDLPWEWAQEFWDEQFYQVWKAGNRILYVDEVTLITPPRSLLPQYSRCVKTGRERGVSVWSGSQRPKDIPSPVFTECEHFFTFRLQWEDDRAKVASFTCDRMYQALEEIQAGGRAHKHDFVYYNVDDDRLVRRVPPVRPQAPVESVSPVT